MIKKAGFKPQATATSRQSVKAAGSPTGGATAPQLSAASRARIAAATGSTSGFESAGASTQRQKYSGTGLAAPTGLASAQNTRLQFDGTRAWVGPSTAGSASQGPSAPSSASTGTPQASKLEANKAKVAAYEVESAARQLRVKNAEAQVASAYQAIDVLMAKIQKATVPGQPPPPDLLRELTVAFNKATAAQEEASTAIKETGEQEERAIRALPPGVLGADATRTRRQKAETDQRQEDTEIQVGKTLDLMGSLLAQLKKSAIPDRPIAPETIEAIRAAIQLTQGVSKKSGELEHAVVSARAALSVNSSNAPRTVSDLSVTERLESEMRSQQEFVAESARRKNRIKNFGGTGLAEKLQNANNTLDELFKISFQTELTEAKLAQRAWPDRPERRELLMMIIQLQSSMPKRTKFVARLVKEEREAEYANSTRSTAIQIMQNQLRQSGPK